MAAGRAHCKKGGRGPHCMPRALRDLEVAEVKCPTSFVLPLHNQLLMLIPSPAQACYDAGKYHATSWGRSGGLSKYMAELQLQLTEMPQWTTLLNMILFASLLSCIMFMTIFPHSFDHMHPSVPICLWCRHYPVIFCDLSIFTPRGRSYSFFRDIYTITSSQFTSHASHIHNHVFGNAILFFT